MPCNAMQCSSQHLTLPRDHPNNNPQNRFGRRYPRAQLTEFDLLLALEFNVPVPIAYDPKNPTVQASSERGWGVGGRGFKQQYMYSQVVRLGKQAGSEERGGQATV